MSSFHRKVLLSISVLLLISFLPLVFVEKGYFVLWLNQNHTQFLDRFFVITSEIGSGMLFVPLILILLLFSYRQAFFTTAGVIFHAAICSVAKNFIYSDAPRPRAFFDGITQLTDVPGVSHHWQHAFPSGHTASAFVLAITLLLIIRKEWAYVFLLPAILVGISRIYLAQHFYADVVGGALVGSVSVLFAFVITSKFSWTGRWQYGLLLHRQSIGTAESENL